MRELSLALAGNVAKLEHPQVGGGALGESTANHHAFKKFQSPEFDGNRINFPQLKTEWQESIPDDTSIAGSTLELKELCRHLPKIAQAEVMVMDKVSDVWKWL